MPTVSVILPTFNRATLIPRAIRSVLTQSYKDLELIIIDDGSIDNTEDIIKNLMQSDHRIKYYKSSINKGVSNARNIGIKIAAGKYIAFQDSDDEWLPGKLEKQVSLLESLSTDIGVIYCYAFWANHPKKKVMHVKDIFPDEPNVFKKMLGLKMGNFILQSCLFRRQVFEKCGFFDERFKVTGDREFFIRISKSFKFYCLQEYLVKRYKTENSLKSSKNNFAALKSSIYIFIKYFPDIIKDMEILLAQIDWILLRLKRLIKGYAKRMLSLPPLK